MPVPSSKPVQLDAAVQSLEDFRSETTSPSQVDPAVETARWQAAFDQASTQAEKHTAVQEIARQSRPHLVWIVAAIATLEAVPTTLWVRQTLASPVSAPAAIVPAVSLPNPVASPACEALVAKPEAASMVAAKGSSRTTPAKAAGTAGAVAAVVPGAMGGRIAVQAPVAMHIYSRGRIVGTTEAETVMLPVGTHELSFINEAVGYEAQRRVTVQAGRTTNVVLEAPSATVNVNATPWAEVWIDRQRVGETPIANLRVPIGTREFVFRHPEHGERRRTALVTLKEPVRISMDMRTK